MGKGTKLVLGIVFGLLLVFAAIGLKSILGGKESSLANAPDNGFIPIQPQGSIGAGSTGTGTTATNAENTTLTPPLSQQDVAQSGNDATLTTEPITIEGEEKAPATADTTNTTINNTENNTGLANGQTPLGQTPTSTPQTPLTPTPTTNQVGTQPLDTAAENPPTSTQTTLEGNVEVVDDYGRLSLSMVDPASSGAVSGEFLVYNAQNLQVASFSGGDQTKFDLAPGDYRVEVSANGKQSSRQLTVYKDKITNARFELPATPAPSTTPQQTLANAKGQLLVTVRAAESNAPVKANIYVQTPNGMHIARKDYDDTADFLLAPGTYKVTVKANGRKDLVREIKVGANGVMRESFPLQANRQSGTATTSIQSTPATPTVTIQTPAPSTSINTISTTQSDTAAQEGVLNMKLSAAAGLPERARFSVRDQNGNRVANIGPIGSTEIKLPAGRYEVSAALERGVSETQTIDVVAGKTSQVNFDAASIVDQSLTNPDRQRPERERGRERDRNRGEAVAEQRGGRLQLYAVSGADGQPLRVNFTVSTLQGNLIQTLNDVSYAELAVPPQDVVVEISYQGSNGQKIITVGTEQPTVYTFTVTPNGNTATTQPPVSAEEAIMQQLQQEILRRMQ